MLMSEYLYAAADHMDEHGWTQQTAENNAGEVCLLGALSHVSERAGMLMEGRRRLTAEITAHHGLRCSVPYWNDLHCKDKAEAVYVLRLAAKTAENEGC